MAESTVGGDTERVDSIINVEWKQTGVWTSDAPKNKETKQSNKSSLISVE